MELIVAVDLDYGIGLNDELLCYIPTDLKRFKALTSGQVIVMGRKTLLSFPNQKPLPNRDHIILSRNKDLTFQEQNVDVCHDINSLLEKVSQINDKKVFVIGGGIVYKELLPYCEKAHVTKINKSFKADTFFPDLDAMENWVIKEESEAIEENGVEYKFVTYINKRK